MTRPLMSLVRWLGRRTLNTQLLILVTSVCVFGVAITGGLSYLRSQQETRDESQAWALALARLAAKSSAAPVIERDFGTLELTLQELTSLPGVQSVEIAAPGGLVLLNIHRQASGKLVVEYPVGALRAGPTGAPADRQDDVFAHASLISSTAGHTSAAADAQTLRSEGWVEVVFSHQQRMAQSNRNWLIGVGGALLAAGLGLLMFYLFLQRAIRPVGELARFANRMATQPGDTLKIRWRSREVRELGQAINWASRELASRMQDTQQKLARLHAILDTAADAIVGVSADGRIVTLNPAAERMLGLDAAVMQGRPLENFVPDMNPQRLQSALAEGTLIYSTQSRIGQLELTALRHDGTPFPIELLIGETRGDPEIHFTCIVRDLSDMKQAEAYLTLYGRVLDCTMNGIAISSARQFPQPIVHVNPAFTRITGYEASEVLGRNLSLLVGPATDAQGQEQLDQAMQQGRETTLTLAHARKDKSVFYNKLSVSPVMDDTGAITHYISVIEDVSTQIEVKRKLIERTARLNASFNLSPGGFAVFDAQGVLVTTNPALRAMIGEVPSWCTLQRFDIWFRNLCDDYESYPLVSASLKAGGKHTLELARPGHKVLEREIRRNLGGSGETFLYFRDITHQFEVDRMKSEFLATAAHELRTPLASILGFTELMIHRRYSEERQKDLLQTVHRQGTLLSNLIQELLDLSRIEARQGKDFHIVPTPLQDIVSHAVSGITDKDLGRIVAYGELPELTVMADASKIQQALTNLLSNAFKYSPGQAHVELAVETDMQQQPPMVHIRVSDQGMGMKPEQLARAFERFYRADGSGNIPGTGLGLNLVKEIAEIHGGSVALSSQPGVGTVATLSLRLAVAGAIAQPTETVPEAQGA